MFGDQNSDEEPVEAPRTAEDEAFIDDEGAEPADDVFGDDEEGEGMGDMLEAAEDDDEIDRMLNKKKRRAREQSMQDVQVTVENFLARMEAAAEGDMEANQGNKPAIHKLRMLPDVQDMLSNQNIHNEFLDGGLLGVFKAWIEPMPDGSLPNITVRTAVLKLLSQLPIDISFEGRKEQLKKSGLGRVVMFLFKLPDETAANRFAWIHMYARSAAMCMVGCTFLDVWRNHKSHFELMHLPDMAGCLPSQGRHTLFHKQSIVSFFSSCTFCACYLTRNHMTSPRLLSLDGTSLLMPVKCLLSSTCLLHVAT